MEKSMLASLVTTMALVFCISDIVSTGQAASVIVVGAGMSGISAAKVLSDAGIKDILILEATNRIGGRMCKTNFAGLSVEKGANWVEGVGGSQMNPIWEMANKLHLKTFLSNFDNLSSNTYKQVGGLYKESVAEEKFDLAEKLYEKSENISTSLAAHNGQEDISILASQRLQNQLRTILSGSIGLLRKSRQRKLKKLT